MKSILVLIIALFIASGLCAQPNVTMTLKFPDGSESEKLKLDNDDWHIIKSQETLTEIMVKASLKAGEELKIVANGETKIYKETDGSYKSFTFSRSILMQEIKIEQYATVNPASIIAELKFSIVNDAESEEGDATGKGDREDEIAVCINCAINKYLKDNYSNKEYELTAFGLYEKKVGTVHLFFDQNGNSLLTTIPQGISNAKYVVHIIYPVYASDPDAQSFSVKQKSGSFSSGLLFNNEGIRNNLGGFSKQAGTKGEKPVRLEDKRFLLGTATDDLSFEIIVTLTEGKKATKSVLETYTIKMSPVYHGSFDVGLLKTNLSNPEYSLLQNPDGTNNVVKETDGGPRGVATIMASFYTSPVILIESLFAGKNSKIPKYKLTGRNFLDDHKLYERIYPTIGVGISSKVFDNLFLGFNWELARGLNFFAGWHYGKVNVFKMPGYVEGTTSVTQEQFDFYKKTEWKSSTAIGIKLDALIIRNLFGSN